MDSNDARVESTLGIKKQQLRVTVLKVSGVHFVCTHNNSVRSLCKQELVHTSHLWNIQQHFQLDFSTPNILGETPIEYIVKSVGFSSSAQHWLSLKGNFNFFNFISTE